MSVPVTSKEGEDNAKDNCVSAKKKERSNDSTSGSGAVVTNQKPTGNNSQAPMPHRAKNRASKLACIKIVTDCSKRDCDASSNNTVEIVPAASKEQTPKKKKAAPSQGKGE